MDEPTSRPHATAHHTDAVRRLDRRLFQARAAIAWEEFWRALWPVIALGGAGQIVHLKDAFDAGAEAAACGSLFNFGDNNPLRAKALLKIYGVPLKRI